MNPAELIDKWCRAELTERSAAQEHFLGLCDLLDYPKPAAAAPLDDRQHQGRELPAQGEEEGGAPHPQ
jgi:hypothetical protein